MGSDPVTVVGNSVHCHDQSIDLGIYDSDTALRPDWNEAALRHADSTFVVVFVEEHSLRVLAVHLAKSWRICHLSDVAGKCMDQWHHTFMAMRCWKLLSTVPCGLSRSHKWEFLVLLTPSQVKWASSVNKMLRIIWGLELIQWHDSNRLHLSAGSRCWMFWMWYRYIPSVCGVHRTLRIEVSTSGLKSRANSESEVSYCICTHGSDLQWLLSLEQLKCSRYALGGCTHVTRPVVLQIANRAVIWYCVNCSEQ